MKLRKLLKKIPIAQVKGSKDVEITGICANSKVVAPGNLFIAKKGSRDDGNRYISDAVESGAVAVLTDIYNPLLDGATQLIVPNVEELEADLATAFYDCPSSSLYMVGVTGTNGKTITTFLIRHLLESSGIPCGLMGTVEYIVGRSHYTATRTTPDVSTNHKLLREMVANGLKAGVMEVTSHGLDQSRVANIDYDVGVFTNFSQDHLDYHGDMESYFEAKAKLFEMLEEGKGSSGKEKQRGAVINGDDSRGASLASRCRVPVLTYGMETPCDLMAKEVELTQEETRFKVTFQGEEVAVRWPHIGRFNVYNFLAACGVGLVRQMPLQEVVKKLQGFVGVRGRLQEVPNELGIRIYVDFAHTDDALENVLQCLREVQTGRILTVFGCGGCRDRSKRPKMARAAEKYSAVTLVTSDNPRKEIPEAICEEVALGFEKPDSHMVEPDRKKAIEKAIQLAEPGDIVLLAGKGHESYQIFAHETIEFDDAKVAHEVCEAQQSATLCRS